MPQRPTEKATPSSSKGKGSSSKLPTASASPSQLANTPVAKTSSAKTPSTEAAPAAKASSSKNEGSEDESSEDEGSEDEGSEDVKPVVFEMIQTHRNEQLFFVKDPEKWTPRMARAKFVEHIQKTCDMKAEDIDDAIVYVTPYAALGVTHVKGKSYPLPLLRRRFDKPFSESFDIPNDHIILLFRTDNKLSESLVEKVQLQKAELDTKEKDFEERQMAMLKMLGDIQEKEKEKMVKERKKESEMMMMTFREELKKEREMMMKQGQKAEEKIEKLRKEQQVDRQKAETDRQKAEADRQKAEVDRQKAEVDRQKAEVDRQKAEDKIQKLEKEQQKMQADIVHMKKEKEELKADLDKERERAKLAEETLEKTTAAQAANMIDTDEFIANGCRQDTAAYRRIKIRHLLNLTLARLANCTGLSTSSDGRTAMSKWRDYCEKLKDEVLKDGTTYTKLAQAATFIQTKYNKEGKPAAISLIASGALKTLLDDTSIRNLGNQAAHPGALTKDNAAEYTVAIESLTKDNAEWESHLKACVTFLLHSS